MSGRAAQGRFPMSDVMSSLLPTLVAARHFEQAAVATLRTMLRQVAEETSGQYGDQGRVLRGLVQLRPHDTYQRLLALEWEDAQSDQVDPAALAVGADANLLASATAWRTVLQHRSAVAIDVHAGTFQLLGQGEAGLEPKPLAGTSFKGSESIRRYLGRKASHVCVLPLRGPGSEVQGMLSLEADCMVAIGEDFVWPDCAQALQLAADVATPYLNQLPLQSHAAVKTDELLPVVGASMADLIAVLSVFARQEETLLINGPTGAGKSRLARWCHSKSARREGPFEVLDLMTVPEDIQMAELFGWKKGAFTGANRDSQGSLGRAEGGTLFIDEIDKLSLRAQAGLLNLLESRVYRMLGDGSPPRPANVRFMVGTNRDLRAEVKEGRFREDLYYRINVLPVRLPPLDERRDELPLWAQFMLERRHQETHSGAHARLSKDAEHALLARLWPGNLRQLDNIIRRAYSLALVEHGAAARELVLQQAHVERALQYETAPSRSALLTTLRAAADAFIQEAQRANTPWDLDLADAFKGLVLGSAVQQFGLEGALRLLDREPLLRSRNHHRLFKRELERLEALAKTLQLESVPFGEVLGSKEPES
jgi:transcriptional regulator with AAA-type ATPase domain